MDSYKDMTLSEILSQPFKGMSGCGSHMCAIEKPEGMGTNGPCSCLTHRAKASMIIQRLAFLRDKAIKEEEQDNEDS